MNALTRGFLSELVAVNEPKLKIRGLAKKYGSVLALATTNLDIPEGEFVTLLGPSGSGKTTLLMMVAGLVEPDEGEIWIDNALSTRTPVHKRGIGMVFQNYALFPHLTIRENVAFPLRMRGATEKAIKESVGHALDMVRLSGMEERFPRQLSGGQQQRVALARCFVYQPSIILMDEPLGALDRRLREEIQHEIRDIHRKLGATVLYVTHDQDEAMVLSDRICLMRGGGIVQQGKPSDLYLEPNSVFSARFFGDTNVFSGRVKRVTRAQTEIDCGNGLVILARPCEETAVGTEVVAIVRPEKVRLLDDGQSASNELVATKLDSMLLAGGVMRHVAETGVSNPVLIKSFSYTRNRGEGTPVRVGWDHSDVLVVPDSRQ